MTVSVNHQQSPHFSAEVSNNINATDADGILPSAFPNSEGDYVCSITLCKLTPDQDDVLWLPSDQKPSEAVWYFTTQEGSDVCLRPFDRKALIKWFKTACTDPASRDEINNDTLILSTRAKRWDQPEQVRLTEITPRPRLTCQQVIQTVNNARAERVVPNLRGANLSGVDLRDIDLSDADLRGADLREADLREADLREADLSGADLLGANLSGANLYWAELDEAKLQGADLSQANLSEACFVRAKLEDANLQGANLSLANFLGADLQGANLSNTELMGTSLRQTNLANTRFCDAELSRADFGGCQSLHGADFRGATLDYVDNLFEIHDWQEAIFSIWQNITLGIFCK